MTRSKGISKYSGSHNSIGRCSVASHTDSDLTITGADFLAFLRHVTRAYPEGDLHVVLDNVSTHKTPAVQAWLPRHRWVTFHFTPTSASWMNQIETWFGILTRGPIRRGGFGSVKALIAAIDLFTASWNAGSSPFIWTKTADARPLPDVVGDDLPAVCRGV